jgi:hypothetical protein
MMMVMVMVQAHCAAAAVLMTVVLTNLLWQALKTAAPSRLKHYTLTSLLQVLTNIIVQHKLEPACWSHLEPKATVTISGHHKA